MGLDGVEAHAAEEGVGGVEGHVDALVGVVHGDDDAGIEVLDGLVDLVDGQGAAAAGGDQQHVDRLEVVDLAGGQRGVDVAEVADVDAVDLDGVGDVALFLGPSGGQRGHHAPDGNAVVLVLAGGAEDLGPRRRRPPSWNGWDGCC